VVELGTHALDNLGVEGAVGLRYPACAAKALCPALFRAGGSVILVAVRRPVAEGLPTRRPATT
jgi:hypothetical protein